MYLYDGPSPTSPPAPTSRMGTGGPGRTADFLRASFVPPLLLGQLPNPAHSALRIYCGSATPPLKPYEHHVCDSSGPHTDIARQFTLLRAHPPHSPGGDVFVCLVRSPSLHASNAPARCWLTSHRGRFMTKSGALAHRFCRRNVAPSEFLVQI